MATKANLEQDNADYMSRFDEEYAPQEAMSEDESMGIAPEAGPASTEAAPEPAMAQVEGGAAEEMGETPATEGAEPAAPGAPTEAGMTEQQLKSWEGRIKAKEQELNAREASMTTSNVGETQTSSEDEGMNEGMDEAMEGETPAEESAENSDPEKALGDDFGSEFVELMRAFIMKVSGGGTGADNGLADTVQSLIEDLREERQSNHFNRISEAHADFMEVVETPEFSAWKESQPDTEQLARIVESGSSAEIIGMLTKFKTSHQASAGGSDEMDDEMAGAEGVRSNAGLKLPDSPKNSLSYEDAWNEA